MFEAPDALPDAALADAAPDVVSVVEPDAVAAALSEAVGVAGFGAAGLRVADLRVATFGAAAFGAGVLAPAVPVSLAFDAVPPYARAESACSTPDAVSEVAWVIPGVALSPAAAPPAAAPAAPSPDPLPQPQPVARTREMVANQKVDLISRVLSRGYEPRCAATQSVYRHCC
ncbi:MAG: hypothetical protein H0W67_08945 [Gemmatimonadales bacterium]|nr:hypothetical protein [Gemmatimonadales bacterium]